MIADEESARAFVREHWGDIGLAKLDQLAEMLTAENTSQNLIAAATVPNIFRRHMADSAQLLKHVPRGTLNSWLDLGSGAGFPGLVVAALEPNRAVVVVESRGRRIDWLRRAVNALDLKNVQVIGQRLELVQTIPVGVISARAFAPLQKTLALAGRFSTSETLWLLPKGRSAQQELQSIGKRGALFHVEHSLTDPEAGIIVGHLAAEKAEKA